VLVQFWVVIDTHHCPAFFRQLGIYLSVWGALEADEDLAVI
jgi:Na+-translocating ferredoxin:NAD+ oxidoreductase RnfA subunit